MSPEWFYLAFIPDIFGDGEQLFFTLKGGETTLIAPEELEKIDRPIVCFPTNELLEQLRKTNIKPPTPINDLEYTRKLSVGLPSKAMPKKLWDGWHVLRNYSKHKNEIEDFRSLFLSKKRFDEIEDIQNIAYFYLIALQSAWLETINLLKEQGEFDRYFEIEAPVQNLLNVRQSIGIRVNQTELNEKYNVLRDSKYKAYMRVAEALNISPSGFTFRSIRDHLNGTELQDLRDGTNVSQFEQNLKLASSKSRLATDIYSLLRADRDLRVLSRLSDVSGRSFPSFTGVGTVTGRILVRNPYVQGIRKEFRSIVAAEEGYSLVYLDYDQFEPGILASLSGDENLKKLYETGDIYTELAGAVFADKTKRSDAKQIFNSFLNGMSEDRIAKMLYAGQNDDDGVVSEASTCLEVFFSKFPKALRYRELVRAELLRNGRVATGFGGHRKRSDKGPLSNKEKRWALNQRIQGTGSLIFKEAILMIAEKLDTISLVLPMHDALLLQAKTEQLDKDTTVAIKLMSDAMKIRCPDLHPKVSIEDFAANQR